MKERPIIFGSEMVRAILAGRKSQFRRVVKPQPVYAGEVGIFNRLMIAKDGEENPGPEEFGFFNEDQCNKSPFGQPGDRLWVRETFDIESFGAGVAQIRYRAGNYRGKSCGVSDRKLPDRCCCVSSIRMPRHCSRITLEIVHVRVERLARITEEDAIAEGVNGGCVNCRMPEPCGCNCPFPVPLDAFQFFWNSTNKQGYKFHHNPWVWVVEFNRVESES